MSDLEDDVLMAYIKQGQELLSLQKDHGHLKKREMLQQDAWLAFDRLLRKLLETESVRKNAESEIFVLKTKLKAIIEFDEHEGG